MVRIRIEYGKRGDMRFIGHLDTMRIFFRSFRRARLPLLYTQGFSPRIKSSSSPPLPLGFFSDAEYLDIFLEGEASEEMIKDSLGKNLPEGLDIIDIKSSPLETNRNSQIKEILYEVDLTPVIEGPMIKAGFIEDSKCVDRREKAINFLRNLKLINHNKIKEIRVIGDCRIELRIYGLTNPRKILVDIIGIEEEALLGCFFKRVKINFSKMEVESVCVR